jgi:hypothetical protein
MSPAVSPDVDKRAVGATVNVAVAPLPLTMPLTALSLKNPALDPLKVAVQVVLATASSVIVTVCATGAAARQVFGPNAMLPGATAYVLLVVPLPLN